MIQERGKDVPYQTVVDCFQEIFHGDGSNGLILREQWVARDGLIRPPRSAAITWPYSPADYAGRPTYSVAIPAGRLRSRNRRRRCTRTKPDPEGLLKICSTVPHDKCWYVGDTVDDARASSAAKSRS